MWHYAEHWLQAHAAIGLATGGIMAFLRYLPKPLLELVVMFSKDEDRRLFCLELLRLRRKDAASIASYLPDQADNAPAGSPDGSGSTHRRGLRALFARNSSTP